MNSPASLPAARAMTKHSLPPFLLHPSVLVGGLLIATIVLVAIVAPYLGTVDPGRIAPSMRLKPPSELAWFGTDLFGRDVYSRAIYGARSSMLIGLCVATAALVIGVTIGLVGGYFRWVDVVVMRIMDGLMAIPTFLLAIALVSLTRASIATVVVALTVPEIPRVVRLVRSVVLTVREEPYVEAAISVGTSIPAILFRHLLPSTYAPLMVLGTYICASAILIEAGLSFLGTGLPPEIPSWGNMISEGRTFFQVAPRLVFLPSLFLALTVLGINLLGDGLRDALDPRIAKRM
ncbi:ABC transporter permease [Rhizobium sp. BR 315]|uniref:Peptide/nickel transport system permease protein n=2 Tax=Rhizobium/Agrobacterium group TaxID=227290 RepID=A0A1C3UBV2_9HYPH|nr:ABC transporter permease [Rhizobium miluonense]SCB12885.1 peptide/nickel transport system permease protein [Rhizobium miluonense]